MDVHYFAVLIGVGATTVNAYLAQEGILDSKARGLFPNVGSTAEVMQRFKAEIDACLLKIMSKMGISIISSSRGGYNFESIGLSRSLVAEFFPGMPSRISGIGLQGIQRRCIAQHKEAFNGNVVVLPVGGLYKYRRSGERHVWTGPLIHTLQSAVTTGSDNTFRKFSEGLRSREPLHLRDLLDFRSDRKPRASGKSRKHHRNPQAFRDAGDVAWGVVDRSPRSLGNCHEPDRCQVEFGRRRGNA